jgi:hypothetical protein
MAGVSGVAAWSRPQCRDIGRLDIFAGDDRRNLHIYAEPQRKQVAYTAMPFCEWGKLHRAFSGLHALAFIGTSMWANRIFPALLRRQVRVNPSLSRSTIDKAGC